MATMTELSAYNPAGMLTPAEAIRFRMLRLYIAQAGCLQNAHRNQNLLDNLEHLITFLERTMRTVPVEAAFYETLLALSDYAVLLEKRTTRRHQQD